MEQLLAPDLLGILIQTVGAIVVALIAKWGVNKKKSDKNNNLDLGEKEMAETYPANASTTYRPGIFIKQWLPVGVVGALTFSLIGFAYNSLKPSPTVGLTSPRTNEQVQVKLVNGGGGLFSVGGTSERVASDADLTVIVLVHPVEPFVEGWWIQPLVTMQPNGDWTGEAQIGNVEYPPGEGHLLDIVAIATERNQKQSGEHIGDPKDLNPASQSNVVRIEIGSVERN